MEKRILSEFGGCHENAGLFLRENRRQFGGVGAARADKHDNRNGGADSLVHTGVLRKTTGGSMRCDMGFPESTYQLRTARVNKPGRAKRATSRL